MTIRYQNGTCIEGITVTRTNQCLRVAVQGAEDLVQFLNFNGTWVAEDCEPVSIQFSPSTKGPVAPNEDDFLCPRETVEHLIRLLYTDSSEDLPVTCAEAHTAKPASTPRFI